MVVFPNAKINIGLDVLCRRSDGYHDISTVMIPIPWRDILEIVPGGDEDSLEVSGRLVDCPPEKNLVIKAVKELRKSHDFPAVKVHLHKVVPDGAGLGGGSADAAFTLKALNELFSLGCSDEELSLCASHLGADCSFFIYNKPMLCEGIGTTLSPIALNLPSGLTIVVVKPAVSVSTKEAYSGVAPAEPETPLEKLLALPVEQWQGCVKNDFEASLFPQYPAIERVKTELLAMGAVYAAMSGSGSSVFGLFDGDRLTDDVAARFEGCDILVSKL